MAGQRTFVVFALGCLLLALVPFVLGYLLQLWQLRQLRQLRQLPPALAAMPPIQLNCAKALPNYQCPEDRAPGRMLEGFAYQLRSLWSGYQA